MKIFALLVILALHATGLWAHTPVSFRERLTLPAAGTMAVGRAPDPNPTPGPVTPLPVRMSPDQLNLDVGSAIAIDRTTGTNLYSQNAGDRRPIASITKLITALVVLADHRPTDIVTIPTLPEYPTDAETMGLTPGDTFVLNDLLQAALVPSENDAADSLAIWDAGSVTKFAAKMNQKMSEWGIADARFVSASGLQDTGNYASAAALGKIAGLALSSQAISQIVSRTQISLMSGQGRAYNLKSTNSLLASGGFYGIKTGYTLAAGECFVGVTRISGHEVITVVLGANDRFGTTTQLTNWIGHTWQWL